MNKNYTMALVKVGNYKNSYIPQANNLNKIVVIIDVLKHSYINEKDISMALYFPTMKSAYYADALRFLEIIETLKYGNNKLVGLSEKMIDYFGTKRNTKQLLKDYIINGKYLDKYEKRLKEEDLNDATTKKREESFNS